MGSELGPGSGGGKVGEYECVFLGISEGRNWLYHVPWLPCRKPQTGWLRTTDWSSCSPGGQKSAIEAGRATPLLRLVESLLPLASLWWLPLNPGCSLPCSCSPSICDSEVTWHFPSVSYSSQDTSHLGLRPTLVPSLYRQYTC